MSRISVLTVLGALAAIFFLAPGATPVRAGEFIVRAEPKTDFKAVFGRVESRDLVQARARIGGTIVTLDVEEGSPVRAGAVIARVVDDKLALHMGALDARLKELDAEIQNAATELARRKITLCVRHYCQEPSRYPANAGGCALEPGCRGPVGTGSHCADGSRRGRAGAGLPGACSACQ